MLAMKSVLFAIFILIILDIILVVAIIWNIYGDDEKFDGPSMIRGTCTTSECLTVSSTLLKSSNQKIHPCQSFYKFVCEGFRTNAFLPNDEFYVTNTFTTSALMEIKFNELLNEPIAKDDPNYFKMMKKYYRACKDKRLVESESEDNLLEILKKLRGWPILEGDNWNETEFDWIETLFKAKKLGFPFDYYIKLEPKYQKLHIREGESNESKNGNYYKYYLQLIAKVLGASINDAAVVKQMNETYQLT